MFEVRITKSEFDFSDFEKVIFFKEGDGNKVKHHLQGIIYDDITAATVRNRLKKYGLKGNQDYKVSLVRDEEKYLAYIAKDGNMYVNTTDIDMDKYKGKFVDIKKSLSKVDKIFQNAEMGAPTSYYVDWAVSYFIENDLLINPNLIKNYVITYMSRTQSSFKKSLISSITFEIDRKN